MRRPHRGLGGTKTSVAFSNEWSAAEIASECARSSDFTVDGVMTHYDGVAAVNRIAVYVYAALDATEALGVFHHLYVFVYRVSAIINHSPRISDERDDDESGRCAARVAAIGRGTCGAAGVVDGSGGGGPLTTVSAI